MEPFAVRAGRARRSAQGAAINLPITLKLAPSVQRELVSTWRSIPNPKLPLACDLANIGPKRLTGHARPRSSPGG